jgi:hypothetical protein
MLDLITAVLLAATNPKVYVNGYGWAPSRAVGACLQYVGEPNVDALRDAQWDSFTDCLNDERRVR